MRLLHVIDTLNPEYGGTPAAVLNLSAGLDAIGCRNSILSLDSPDAPWVKTRAGCTPVGPGKLGRYHYTSALVPALQALAPEHDAAIVHGAWTYSSLGTWRALAKSATPYFIFPHGMLDPWFKHHHRFKHIKKAVYWRLIEHCVFRDAASVLYTAEDERRLSRETFSPYRARRETVVGLGIEPPPQRAAAEAEAFFADHADLGQKRLLLFLGRLHPKKGCDLIVEALGRVRQDARLDDGKTTVAFVGPDNDGLWPGLEKRAGELGVADRIVRLGMLQGDAKWAALRAAEALILPSHQENFGIVVAEALACGTPALISTKVNIWREIEADGAGLVEEDDADGATRLVTRFNALSGVELAAMKQAARRSFDRRYEARAAAENILAALRRCGASDRERE